MRIICKAGLGNSYDQRVILAYGLSKFSFIASNYIIISIIGILFHSLPAYLIYLTSLIILRTYAGGYHAPTKTICFIMTCTIQFAGVLSIRLLPLNPWMAVPEFVILITIYILSPIEAQNKPLSTEEHTIYKKKTGKICILLSILSILGIYLHIGYTTTAIFVSSLETFLLMIPSITKNNIQKFYE